MNEYNRPNSYGFQGTRSRVTMEQYLAKTFLWMVAGLGVTFVTASMFSRALAQPAFFRVVAGIPGFHLLLAVAEMVIVWNLSGKLGSMSTGTATGMFFLYAVINGLTFASILFVYDMSTVLFAFLSAGVYFGVMAAYGYLARKDLTSWGRMISCGLIAMLIVNLLGMFFGFGAFERLISTVGIVLFLCITAYDTQRIKRYYNFWASDPGMLHKASVYGALQLYLDFINIFLYILRMAASRRDD